MTTACSHAALAPSSHRPVSARCAGRSQQTVRALTTDRDHEQRHGEDAEREADPEPRRDTGATLPRDLGAAVCQPEEGHDDGRHADDRHEEAGEAEDDAPGADRAPDDRRVLRQLAELVPGLRELLAGPGDGDRLALPDEPT